MQVVVTRQCINNTYSTQPFAVGEKQFGGHLMAIKMKLGRTAFLGIVGVSVLSGLGALVSIQPIATIALVLLGIVVGLQNISKSETTKFIVSMLALTTGIGVVAFELLGPLATTIVAIFDSLLVGFGTATLAAGLMAVWSISKR